MVRQKTFIVVIAAAVVAFDLFVKSLAAEKLPGSLHVGFVGYYFNERGLFGLAPLPVTIFISLGLLVVFSWLFLNTKSFAEKTAVTLIVAGGLSNFIERITKGGTTDIFIVGKLGAFNVADVVIVIGIMLVTIRQLRVTRTKRPSV